VSPLVDAYVNVTWCLL